MLPHCIRDMSLAPVALETIAQSAPATTFHPLMIPVKSSAGQTAWLQSVATSTGPTTSFSITPPSPSTNVLSRLLLVENTYVMDLTASSACPGGANLLDDWGLSSSLRAFPFNSLIGSATIQINGQSFTVTNWSEISNRALMKFNPRELWIKHGNKAPWFWDQAGINASDKDPLHAGLMGSQRNAMGDGKYGDIDYLRGAWADYVITAKTPTTARLQWTTVEPLVLSPFVPTEETGLPYVQTLNITLQMNQDLRRCLSQGIPALGVGDVVGAGIISTATLVSQASKLYYMSISANALQGGIPPVVNLAYDTIDVKTASAVVPKTAPGVASAGTQVQSQVITYNVVPKLIYCFVGPQASQMNPTVPDMVYALAKTPNCNLQWADQTGLLSSVTREQFYDIAVQCGIALPYQQFAGYFNTTEGVCPGTGSIMVFRPGTDYPLSNPESTSVGSNGQYQFQVAFNVVNYGSDLPADTPSTLYICAVLPGVCSFSNGGSVTAKQGVISTGDVVRALEDESRVEASELRTTGSGFFGNVLSHIPAGLNFVKKVGKTAREVLNKAHDSGLLGEGMDFYGGSAMSGGSALSGGRMLSSKQLASRKR